MTAVVAEPGMPSVSIGTMAPAEAALLADSGAGHALDGAVAELLGVRETFFSSG